ncbi:glycosyl transferase family 1 [Parasaccharibacter sp. TMW2.1882]|uniref:Tetratricopeptide repeat protein n=1 Tax=Parasaccharibacter apium TaxID=1510841 RepID=A0ABX4ZMT1_9PROT|nr:MULTISPECIES: glycosyltransferase [Parasaccharibacter]MUH02685.1 glycosyltransferase [Bombella sp. ESL0387]MCK8636675.1 glycosyl transferase family 1 [Parasaccharibacter sp. TMW2.1885]MCL1496213.1 glycosyl transferase family 1 [Parasaccharibacter sp. TMW2.1882]POS62577.1 tetratricopeptide repeat protein [Parasaccharibacter apium]POS63674.1 tetratricopeptide repeat protein [Parasaccharibacter apium]
MMKFFKFASGVKDNTNYCAVGDRNMKEKKWESAVVNYKKHLELHPGDSAIWVQYAHAQKELGRSELAIAAYEKAVSLDNRDHETFSHLAHLEYRLGKQEEARSHAFEAAKIKPFKNYVDLFVRLGGDIRFFETKESKAKYLIEIDDILIFLKIHKTLSGIQRVQAGIMQGIINLPKANSKNFAFVRAGENGFGFWQISFENISRILEYIRSDNVEQEKLVRLIEDAEREASLISVVKGQVYLILGAFWAAQTSPARYSLLKKSGVSIGVYIYDIIPISYPEYCHVNLVAEFSYALSDGFFNFDFVFTISQYVADEVKGFMREHNLKEIPVIPVTLAHRMNGETNPTLRSKEFEGDLSFLNEREFVLMVSTIEARKNHIYLYRVWKELVKQGVSVPDLVFVGRFGWRVNDLKSMLEDTDFLGDRIHVLHDIGDVELEMLYNKCQFTVFPSFAEGWGLPVGESLFFGKPCVASSSSSIPEVGGDLVDYVDPLNLHEGIEVIRKMIEDAQYRARRSKLIATTFTPRSWDDVTNDLISALPKKSIVTDVDYLPPLLKMGKKFEPARYTHGQRFCQDYVNQPLRLLLADGWYSCEPNLGAWMKGKEGIIEFRTNLPPQTKITAYLDLIAAPWTKHKVRVSAGLASKFPTKDKGIDLVAGERISLPVTGYSDKKGVFSICIEISGEDIISHPLRNAQENRIFYLGLQCLIYVPNLD